MGLTSLQMARLGVLLDEALPLSRPERHTWLASLPAADQPLLRTLREALLADDPAAYAADRLEGPGSAGDGIDATVRQAGELLGAYELLRPLGSGGMAEVWLARRADGAFEREVALKIPRLTNLPAETRQRFARECRILAPLEFPGIARLYDAGVTDEGVPYIAMEYVRGEHLTAWCEARSLDIPARVALFLQVLDAVGHAHERQVLHRDLKPSNILVSERGEVRLLDFGVARLLAPDGDGAALTREYGHALTPAYASPELLRGEPLDARSDLYSLGIVLHELLTGSRPGHGATANLRDPLRGVVDKALQPAPADRYVDAAQFAAALRPFVKGRNPIGWRVAGPIAAGTLAVLAVAALLLYRRHDAATAPQTTAAPAAPVSIAVLPFVNMSEDPRQDYFSDGLSEEIINQLAHIRELRVTARTSAFAFKGRNQDLREIARKLDVANVLEGSVRKEGGKLRITAQLINAADGYHLWSETYERRDTDVFAIQDEIASTVAAKLGLALGVAPRATDFGGTNSFEAYDHLLHGDVEFAKGTLEGMLAATQQYRRALAIDPGYARAWAELTIALGATLMRQPVTEPGFEAEREQAMQRALAAAPDAPLSLIAKMWVHSDRHDWLEADAATMRALASGTDPRAQWIGGGFLTVTGRVRGGLPYREAARRADPLSISVAATVARQYALLGMGDELAGEYARITALSGNDYAVRQEMLAYLMGKGAPAEEVAERYETSCPFAERQVCAQFARIARSGSRAASLLRAQLAAVGAGSVGYAQPIALLAAYMGENEIALDALELVGRSPSTPILQTLWYPVLSEVRKQPRFKRIVRDIGFVDLWRETGRWADVCRPVGQHDFECF